MSGGPHLLDFA